MAFPDSSRFVIIGAGIHGLSTAYQLAVQLKAHGLGSGEDIVILDKGSITAGASGIACGVIRNNYFQPAMRELMAQCVEVWESDPKSYAYHPVGYMQISPECMQEDVCSIAAQQAAIGYDSELIVGQDDCNRYMTGLLEDWQAKNITSVLHEKKGGYSNNTKMLFGLAGKAESEGVRIITGVEVIGFEFGHSSQSITSVQTSKGDIRCDEIVVAPGPWAKQLWELLELPPTVDIKGADGSIHPDNDMWVYWSLQEGTLGVDPGIQRTNDGKSPPVIHVDSDSPLYSDVDGSLITDEMWGIYYKPDVHFGGIQGGAAPVKVETRPDDVAVDPYGTESPDFVVGPEFAHMWCSALAHCQARFKDKMHLYKDVPSGGIGAFTPDSFPVFDRFHENCYFIADSNHGYKMIGVGKLVAEDICGKRSSLLHPFRFARFAEGDLHPVSNSPFPWS